MSRAERQQRRLENQRRKTLTNDPAEDDPLNERWKGSAEKNHDLDRRLLHLHGKDEDELLKFVAQIQRVYRENLGEVGRPA